MDITYVMGITSHSPLRSFDLTDRIWQNQDGSWLHLFKHTCEASPIPRNLRHSVGWALQKLNIRVSFSCGYFIHVTLFDFTVGETTENVGDSNEILPSVMENTEK